MTALKITILTVLAFGAGTWVLLGSPPENSEPSEPAPQVVLPLPKDEAELQTLRRAVLDLPVAELRDDAQDKLQRAGDSGLAVLVDFGLYHEIPLVRTYAADTMGRTGGLKVLKFLVEAFYSASEPTIPPFQREYVKTLREHVSRMTGEDFFFYIRRTTRGEQVSDKLVAWWEANWDRVPPQLGEPKIDATRHDYMNVLRTLRTLNLVERQFGGSNLPPGITTPLDPPRPVDEQFRKDFPTAKRESINSTDDRVRKIPTLPRDSVRNPERK